MSAYLKFFQLEQSPFEGQAQSQVVLGTRALREAFGTVRAGLEEGASRICVSGGPGLGKTSLARALPKLLGESARVAVVPDPSIGWEAARGPIARQWGIDGGGLARPALVAATAARPLVLVLDQAEQADEDFLDHVDVLLSYRTEADAPVVQSVLLARLSGDPKAEAAPILWWLDRLQTLQLEFAPLPRDGVAAYIAKHLRRAGWRGDVLFDEAAAHAIHGYTGGVPGEISALGERLLVEAAQREQHEIDAAFVHAICAPELDSAISVDEVEALAVADEFDDLALEAALSEAAASDEDSEVASATSEAEHPLPTAEASPASASPTSQDVSEALAFFEEAAESPGPASHDGDRDVPTAMDAASVPEREPQTDAEDPLDLAGLDLPFTDAERAALTGGGFARFGRWLAGGALALLVAGIGFFLLAGDESTNDVAVKPPARTIERPAPKPDRRTTPPASLASAAETRPLASRDGAFIDPNSLDPRALARLEDARQRALLLQAAISDTEPGDARFETPASRSSKRTPIPASPSAGNEPGAAEGGTR